MAEESLPVGAGLGCACARCVSQSRIFDTVLISNYGLDVMQLVAVLVRRQGRSNPAPALRQGTYKRHVHAYVRVALSSSHRGNLDSPSVWVGLLLVVRLRLRAYQSRWMDMCRWCSALRRPEMSHGSAGLPLRLLGCLRYSVANQTVKSVLGRGTQSRLPRAALCRRRRRW